MGEGLGKNGRVPPMVGSKKRIVLLRHLFAAVEVSRGWRGRRAVAKACK